MGIVLLGPYATVSYTNVVVVSSDLVVFTCLDRRHRHSLHCLEGLLHVVAHLYLYPHQPIVYLHFLLLKNIFITFVPPLCAH
jgi:hypothetical protein